MSDKVIVVVGATGGIGTALISKLIPTKSKLVLAAKNHDKLSLIANSIPTENQVLTIPTDITKPDQVNNLITQTINTFGQIDVLVNAAGAGILKPFDKITPHDLDQMLEVNLKGSFYTSLAAAQVMKDKRTGHICNVVGILGKHSMTMATAYCAAKFGVVGFSKSLAEEIKRYGIKLTLFYFGGVDTPFWDTINLKFDRSKMLRPTTAADAIFYAINLEPQAVPMEINIQPDSHLFF